LELALSPDPSSTLGGGEFFKGVATEASWVGRMR